MSGVIYDVRTEFGIDKKTEIRCIDVTNQYMDIKVNKSYKEGTEASFIIRDIFKKCRNFT